MLRTVCGERNMQRTQQGHLVGKECSGPAGPVRAVPVQSRVKSRCWQVAAAYGVRGVGTHFIPRQDPRLSSNWTVGATFDGLGDTAGPYAPDVLAASNRIAAAQEMSRSDQCLGRGANGVGATV